MKCHLMMLCLLITLWVIKNKMTLSKLITKIMMKLVLKMIKLKNFQTIIMIPKTKGLMVSNQSRYYPIKKSQVPNMIQF